MKKEKVISIRVTVEDYDTLEWARLCHWNPQTAKTMSRFVGHLLQTEIKEAEQNRAAENKREAAAAKRRANREAKKAANDTI